MEKYLLVISCELLNEMGILVAHRLKAVVPVRPQIADTYQFETHYKSVMIQLTDIRCLPGYPGLKLLHCKGEEVDETGNIQGRVPETAFRMVE
ncbi:DUF5952 family protein [Chitinophaga nivalis]|uniref:Uncharacterized protein n=1 Tax=Chitinophaga nivalis TaxID=2991709 RepID=A0ABT3IJD5_9BACT|nr:DUF5952 family protein [Chitinophaga nivalis]MCW3466237.1 hypothetical protein [Chitinophaga nivalis]MCW3484072.1 hypothetical protein [Chitinophaga nivalis]